MYGLRIEPPYLDGIPIDDVHAELTETDTVWDDCDEAFDDSSHFLHFDMGNKVRLIAFKNSADWNRIVPTIVDVCMPADDFYTVLSEWSDRFEKQWRAAPKQP